MVVWVEAVVGEVGGLGIVKEGVERGDDGFSHDCADGGCRIVVLSVDCYC